MNSPPIVGEGQGVGSVFRMIEHGRATPSKLNLKIIFKIPHVEGVPFRAELKIGGRRESQILQILSKINQLFSDYICLYLLDFCPKGTKKIKARIANNSKDNFKK